MFFFGKDRNCFLTAAVPLYAVVFCRHALIPAAKKLPLPSGLFFRFAAVKHVLSAAHFLVGAIPAVLIPGGVGKRDFRIKHLFKQAL